MRRVYDYDRVTVGFSPPLDQSIHMNVLLVCTLHTFMLDHVFLDYGLYAVRLMITIVPLIDVDYCN